MALRIKDLNDQLSTEKENVKKAKIEIFRVANEIIEDVLKYRVTKLVKKSNDGWVSYKNIPEANMKYLQVQEAFYN